MEKKKELLKPKNDIVFQSLFTQKNERITKNFISALMGENITKIEINTEKELYIERPEDKLGILDLEAEINDKEKVDIEVQLIDRKNLVERMLFYFSKLYASTIDKGELRGKEEGIKQEKIETAKKMKAKNMDINTIIEITELTKEEIEKL